MPDFTDELKSLEGILNSPAVRRVQQQEQAQIWRGQKTADWLNNFVQRMMLSTDDFSPQKDNQHHTVESMVEDLRQRVQLDGITKQAADIPLSIKEAEDQELEDIEEYVLRYVIRPSRGYVDIPAIIDAVKEQFGEEKVLQIGMDRLKEMAEKLREENRDNSLDEQPFQYDGSPKPLRHDFNEQDQGIPGLTPPSIPSR